VRTFQINFLTDQKFGASIQFCSERKKNKFDKNSDGETPLKAQLVVHIVQVNGVRLYL
jgi:hypothetical protein